MRGHMSAELFFRKEPPKVLKKMWSEAKLRLEKQSTVQARKCKPTNRLPANTKIWVFLGPKGQKRKERATVLIDNGYMVVIQKEEHEQNSRYRIISVHKSSISLRK